MRTKELESKVAKWVETLEYNRKENIIVSLIIRLIQNDDVRWSEDRNCPYWESCGEELGEHV